MELSRFCREAAAEAEKAVAAADTDTDGTTVEAEKAVAAAAADREGTTVEAEKAVDLDNREISQAGLAADAVRKLLLDGAFRPGELLPENLLAEYLKMSRTPVREALRRLQAEGVLEYRNGQGTFLKTLTVKELKDIYEVREALETAALRTAVHRISDKEIRCIQQSFQELLQRRQTGEEIDRRSFGRAEQQFHEVLVQNCDNEYIRILARRIHLMLCQYDADLFRRLAAADENILCHLEMVRSLSDRDVKKLTEQLRTHLKWSLEQLILFMF